MLVVHLQKAALTPLIRKDLPVLVVLLRQAAPTPLILKHVPVLVVLLQVWCAYGLKAFFSGHGYQHCLPPNSPPCCRCVCVCVRVCVCACVCVRVCVWAMATSIASPRTLLRAAGVDKEIKQPFALLVIKIIVEMINIPQLNFKA